MKDKEPALVFLNQISNLRNKIYFKEELKIILEAKLQYSSPLGKNQLGSGTSVSYASDKIPLQINNLQEVMDDLEKLYKKISIKAIELTDFIDKNNNGVVAEILYLRFVQCRSILDISNHLNESVRFVSKSLSLGIKNINIALLKSKIDKLGGKY